MSVPLIINGITFNYPQQFDTNWGPTLTAWSTAVTNGLLQKAGGSFPLTAEVDFGASFGLRALYLKSEESNVSSTGIVRLANASGGIGFRNNINSADLILTVNASNLLTFNGVPVGPLGALLNNHIYVGNSSNQPADVAMSGDATIINTGALTIANSAITNAKVNATAAIALSKLASVSAYQWITGDVSGVLGGTSITANRAVQSDANGLPSASSVTSTELGYVSGATSNLQTQINSIAGGAVVPSGAILDFAGTVAPTGFLICDGSSLLRASYPDLFTAIGTTWGSADGTHFNIPALSRRTTVGSGGSGSGTLGNAVGNTGGEETHTMTSGELVTHTHSTSDPGHTHVVPGHDNDGSGDKRYAGALSFAAASGVQSSALSNTTGVTVANTGSSNPFNVIQPSAIVLKIIKT